MNKTLLAEGRFLRFLRLDSGWEFMERTNSGWAVVIAALTEEGEVLLVEQERPPVGARVIELPAGLVGDHAALPDESWQLAAARELEEETGYEAARLEEVARGPVSPGLGTEMIVLVRATGLRRVGHGGGVDHENITVHQVPLGNIVPWLAERQAQGVLIDPKIFSGLFFLQSRG